MPSTDIKDYWRRAWGIGDRVGFKDGPPKYSSKYYKKKSSSSRWLENLKKGIYSRNYQPLENSPRKGARPDVEKWNLDQETKNWINKRYNKTKKPFDEWWKTVKSNVQSTNIRAYHRNKASVKAIQALRDDGYITLKELNDLAGLEMSPGGKAKKPRSKIEYVWDQADEYKTLKPKKITGIYASLGKEHLKSPGASKAMTSGIWFKKPTEDQLDAIKDFHARHGQRTGMKDRTARKIRHLYKDKAFMAKLASATENALSDDMIAKIFGSQGMGQYPVMKLGEILQGKEKLDGIKKNEKLGNAIIKAMAYKISEKGPELGKWQQAAYQYADNELSRMLKTKKTHSFTSTRDDIGKLLKELNLPKLGVDEIQAMRTGLSGKTGIYSVFSQAIDRKMNEVTKSHFDSGTAKRQKKINKHIAGLKSSNKKVRDAAIKEVQIIMDKHEAAKKAFYEDNPKAKGKVRLPSFDLRSPIEVFGETRWKSLHPNIKNAITKNWKEVGYSIDPGKGAFTQNELKEVLEKKLKNNAVKKSVLRVLVAPLSLSVAAVNQAVGAPIKDIPISEKIPFIGGGDFPMTAGKQVSDISDVFRMIKDWDEGRKQEQIEEEIRFQPGVKIPAYDFARGGRVSYFNGGIVSLLKK